MHRARRTLARRGRAPRLVRLAHRSRRGARAPGEGRRRRRHGRVARQARAEGPHVVRARIAPRPLASRPTRRPNRGDGAGCAICYAVSHHGFTHASKSPFEDGWTEGENPMKRILLAGLWALSLSMVAACNNDDGAEGEGEASEG